MRNATRLKQDNGMGMDLKVWGDQHCVICVVCSLVSACPSEVALLLKRLRKEV